LAATQSWTTFSSPCGTRSCFIMYPGRASWAKFSRPCGTKLVNPGSTHPLQPLSGRLAVHGCFSPRRRPTWQEKLRGLKPSPCWAFTTRPKSCPDTKPKAESPNGLFLCGRVSKPSKPVPKGLSRSVDSIQQSNQPLLRPYQVTYRFPTADQPGSLPFHQDLRGSGAGVVIGA
jgi:hypothetical protein